MNKTILITDTKEWQLRPTAAKYWDDDADYVLYIDENGHNSLRNIIKSVNNCKKIDENEYYFNVASVLMTHDEFLKIASSLHEIKHTYWENGIYKYNNEEMIVCLHSKEIRKQEGPFSKNAICQDSFFKDLNRAMKEMDVVIFDCFINKMELYKKYGDNSEEPYCLAIKYILERVLNRINNKNLMIILESRGKKEDEVVLNSIKLLMLKGTYYRSSRAFDKIVGVYFNPKRTKENDKSFIGLEVADLCAYPIYKFCKLNKKDESFKIIENKIYGYPNYYGKGLKIFP